MVPLVSPVPFSPIHSVISRLKTSPSTKTPNRRGTDPINRYHESSRTYSNLIAFQVRLSRNFYRSLSIYTARPMVHIRYRGVGRRENFRDSLRNIVFDLPLVHGEFLLILGFRFYGFDSYVALDFNSRVFFL